MKEMCEAQLRDAFEKRRPMLLSWGNYVARYVLFELKQKLGSDDAVEKFFQIPPKPRVKATESFLEKALVRKPKKDPLNDITDQVGVRFVVLLLEDVALIGEIISEGPWCARKDRGFEDERKANPNAFAYQSDHYIVFPKSAIEYEGQTIPPQLACEVQIRTILQHAYAEMAHTSYYKPSIQLPEAEQQPLCRSLAKGSALIETTDDIFKEIKQRFHDYNRSTEALLTKASQLYTEQTGESSSPKTGLGMLIADTYRDQLKELTPEQLVTWMSEKQQKAIGKVFKTKRNESVFYRDSIVILLAWLVSHYPTLIRKNWPVEMTYLENFYRDIGKSANGLF